MFDTMFVNEYSNKIVSLFIRNAVSSNSRNILFVLLL